MLIGEQLVDIVVLGGSKIPDVWGIVGSELPDYITNCDPEIYVHLSLILASGSRVFILNACLTNRYVSL